MKFDVAVFDRSNKQIAEYKNADVQWHVYGPDAGMILIKTASETVKLATWEDYPIEISETAIKFASAVLAIDSAIDEYGSVILTAVKQ